MCIRDRCKAEERRAQHGNERHVLPRIVDDLQEREQHCDLHRGKKVLARVSGAVEAAVSYTHLADLLALSDCPVLPEAVDSGKCMVMCIRDSPKGIVSAVENTENIITTSARHNKITA